MPDVVVEASVDCRIFTNKELYTDDMADIIDASVPVDGPIQGCEIQLRDDGGLYVSDGRFIMRGRLATVTAGKIPVPTTVQPGVEPMYLVAVCDLTDQENPMRVEIADIYRWTEYGQTATERMDINNDFNYENGLAMIDIGTLNYNHDTGKIVSFTLIPENWTPKKGLGYYKAYLQHKQAMETAVTYYNRVNSYIWRTYTDLPNQASTKITITWNETNLYKQTGIILCTMRFKTNAAVAADTTLFNMPSSYMPICTTRHVFTDWSGNKHRFNLYNTGEFKNVDAIPANVTFIINFVYMTSLSVPS